MGGREKQWEGIHVTPWGNDLRRLLSRMRRLGSYYYIFMYLSSAKSFKSLSNNSSSTRFSHVTLTDSMTDTETVMPQTHIHFFEELGSTQDKAKEIARHGIDGEVDEGKGMFAVVTRQQREGRGTRGRVWQSIEGNLCMTIAIPTTRLSIPLHLLPLRY